ncbi:thymidylate synthase [Cysteiniphilum sp. QT6929]|uniref:thymidylate synthase n=1 Tax=Cysteiniphilum sp. QT6929 TaxID=2975055 RepID=UPI0024B3BE67|nr:thymidylate synthase [Cysteiniphilum sp. QT6929]WHN65210.1 thymidylate synthase [Cysteiniphilum sp. QT6929]
MQQYLNFLRHIKEHGVTKTDRTGTGTQSVFGYQMRFDLSEGFPLVTTKKIHIKSVIHELLWFLKGDTNNNYLAENGVRIWNDWALEDGSLGPIYGKQWRSWQTPDGQVIDQIEEAVNLIKTRPDSRRIIVNSWNPSVLPDESISPQDNVRMGKAALPPCHTLFQFYVADGKLSCMLTQRSADAFLGVPFNIASYALLTHIVAKECDLEVGDFIWSGGDCHIYSNHHEQINEQLTRTPLPLPTLQIKRKALTVFDYQFDDFEIVNYQCHPAIKAQVAV